MTSIAKRTVGTYVGEDAAWRPSDHGNDMTPSATLDVSAFTKATHFPDGYFPSGLVVGKITSSGLFGPYDAEAADGRETPAGHLFASLPVPDGVATVGGALYVHGVVDTSRLPSGAGLDETAKSALNLIRYV